MKGKSRTVARYAAYVVGTLLLTLYFMFLTFPFGRIQDRVLPRIEAGLPLRLTVEDVRASPLLWLRLIEVRGFSQTADRTHLLDVAEVKVRPALLDLVIGRGSFRVRADLLDGKLNGRITDRKGTVDMVFSWKEIRPARHPLLAGEGGARVDAAVAGDLRLTLEGGNWISAEGALSLDIRQGSVEGLQVRGFTLPEMYGIRGGGTLTLGKRKASLETLTLSSDELTVAMDGNIDLSPRFPSSRLNLKGKIKLGGTLETQYDPMLSGFLRNRDAEGFYTFFLRGTAGNPRFSS